MTPTPLGTCLRNLREGKGWKLAELARRADVHSSVIVRIESGEKQEPTFSTVCKLARALGVSVAVFDLEANE